MFTPSSTPNQIRSMPSLSATGASSGTMMKASSKKSRKNASRKTRMLTTIRKPICAARQAGEQVLDPQVAVDAAEGEAEHRRADQDEHHEGGQLGGRVHRLAHQRPAQAPVDEREHQRAGRAHGAAFGRRRDAEEDRAEHEEDQRQRRNQRRRPRGRSSCQPRSVRASRRQRRRRLRVEDGDAEHVDGIQAGEDQAGDDRAGVHVADRAAELVGEHDQHQRRRDDLRQRAGGGDDARWRGAGRSRSAA